MKTTFSWTTTEPVPFSADTITDLVHNRIPLVRLPAFATPDECEALAKQLLSETTRNHSVPQVTRLGISQYQHGVRAGKQRYFELARVARAEQQLCFAESFDPLERFCARFAEIGIDCAVAEEPDFGPYFAGSGKLRSGRSPIHVDYAGQDSPEWEVGRAKFQLAWNLYLRVPDGQGEIQIWDKQWQPEHDVHMAPNNYYFSEAAVAGSPSFRKRPRVGEILLLNSRNYHAVTDAEGRLTLGSFISVMDPACYRLWS